MREPVTIPIEALLLHDEGIAEHGGSPGLRDAGLLESALAGPRNELDLIGAHPDALATMLALAAGELGEDQLAAWTGEHSSPRGP